MSANGYEEVVQVPGGEVLIRIFRDDSESSYGNKYWKGTLACRKCPTDPFREMIYVFEEDLLLVKEYIQKIVKNVFLNRPEEGSIF